MMSWAIARKVGDTNIELQRKLMEVDELSKEKQDLLTRQNSELEEKVAARTLELVTSLKNLTAAQSQLIQSEKMASLGELTAGIAHEIQNPLNFVNNFSEVNKELADELEQEIDKGNYTDAKVLAKDIKENEEKINHHGKRADAIVKGMLQHSRSSSGQKELTDINALCDEYLRLSYHGLRAKDKSFNAKFETHLDPTLPKINVVPQDIGRVVLNLINNAFYAVSEKAKLQAAGFEPLDLF
jgi:signal transduction histidine kinase